MVLPYGDRGFSIQPHPLMLMAAAAASVPEVSSGARVGVSDEIGGMGAMLREHSTAAHEDVSGAVERIRRVKDGDELAKVLHSYELCWVAQQCVGELARSGASEIELFSAACSLAQNINGSPIEFLCDLLSGPNTAHAYSPIHVPGPRTVNSGDVVLADIVIGANGYYGDSAETHVSDDHEAAAQTRAGLVEILNGAATELRPGNTGAHVFSHMQGRILDAFPDGEFFHYGGHGLGLGMFDEPYITPTGTTEFENWMVIALEPGVYFPGRLGARVENLYVVTPDGGVELRALMGAA